MTTDPRSHTTAWLADFGDLRELRDWLAGHHVVHPVHELNKLWHGFVDYGRIYVITIKGSKARGGRRAKFKRVLPMCAECGRRLSWQAQPVGAWGPGVRPRFLCLACEALGEPCPVCGQPIGDTRMIDWKDGRDLAVCSPACAARLRKEREGGDMSEVRHIKVTIDRAELARRLAGDLQKSHAERTKAMAEIKVLIGSVQSGSSGTVTLDTTREVIFQGEKLGTYREPGIGRDGNPTDTRGVTETLYRAADGRLVVHVEDWSHWQGEPTIYHLHEVTEADLAGNGQFARLGLECGYGRPLTLDEGLSPLDREDRAWAEDQEEQRRDLERASYTGAVELDDPESDD